MCTIPQLESYYNYNHPIITPTTTNSPTHNNSNNNDADKRNIHASGGSSDGGNSSGSEQSTTTPSTAKSRSTGSSQFHETMKDGVAALVSVVFALFKRTNSNG